MSEIWTRLNKSLGVMAELTPFLLFRFGVYALVGTGLFVYWSLVCLLAGLLGKVSETIGWLVFLAALAVNYGIFNFLGAWLFYMVKAGYVAVLTEVMARGSIPGGASQVQFAKDAVQKRFGEVAGLGVIDHLVKGCIHSFHATLEGIASWIPIPGLESAVSLVNKVIGKAGNLVDEAVLSRVFFKPDDDVWRSCRDGVVLYAQNWKPILQMAAVLVVIDWVMTTLTFLMMTVVVGIPIFVIFPQVLQFLAFVAPFLAAYVVRLGFLEPLGVTAVILTFHDLTRKAEISPEVEANLERLSAPFRELKAKMS